MRYTDRPLFWQLLIPMLLVTGLWAASAVVAVVGLNESRALLHGLYTNNVGVVFQLERLDDRFSKLNLMLLQHLASEAAHRMDAIEQDLETLQQETFKTLDTVEASFLTAHPDRAPDFRSLRKIFADYVASAAKVLWMSADFEKEAAFSEFNRTTQPSWHEIRSAMSALSGLEAATMEQAFHQSVKLEHRNTLVTVGASVGAGLLALVILFGIAQHTAARLQKVARTAAALGGGNLSARADDDSLDEIGRLGQDLGQMAVQLETSMAELESSTQALRRAHRDLEQRIADRTKALSAEVDSHRRTERDLLRAKEQAELANKAKSEFLANMSHELRTPLNAVIGFADMIRHEILGPIQPPKYLDYIDDIHKSGNHLLGLIGEILDMAKIEAGRFTIHIEDVAIQETIDDALVMVRGRAQAARVGLDVLIAEDLPPVAADRQAAKQVLLNLLTNAVKFTPEGGTVTVRASIAGDGGKVAVEVADTGVGMSAADIGRAFQPFVQIEREKGRSHEGTGLGLPLSRKLIELQGGTLELASTLGNGTTATFTLPVSDQA